MKKVCNKNLVIQVMNPPSQNWQSTIKTWKRFQMIERTRLLNNPFFSFFTQVVEGRTHKMSKRWKEVEPIGEWNEWDSENGQWKRNINDLYQRIFHQIFFGFCYFNHIQTRVLTLPHTHTGPTRGKYEDGRGDNWMKRWQIYIGCRYRQYSTLWSLAQ